MNITNLKRLRKSANLTQEQVAEELNVSRQTVAKWETGESLPDMDSCISLARLYKVTLDDLVFYAKNPKKEKSPDGKHIFGVSKIDEKGRIILPEESLSVFGLKPGDKLIVLGDERQGLALVKINRFLGAITEIMNIIEEIDDEEDEE